MKIPTVTQFTMRGWIAAAVVLLVHWAAEAQIVLDGTYRGLGPAEGSILQIAPDPGGFKGEFRPRGGEAQRFEADRRGDQAEAVVRLGGAPHLMQISPLPYGAEMALIPVSPDGALSLDGARLETYLRDGISRPEPPEGYVDAPEDALSQIAANSFLVSYEFWRPQGVVFGYLSLPPRMTTLMRLFPAVQLDVIWKLCLSPRADAALARALPGQGTDCDSVVAGLAEIQAEGRFDAYKAEVGRQKANLLASVRCADRYVMAAETCRRAAARLSEAALRMETAATVLRRYR